MLAWLFRPQCASCGVLSEPPLCEACAESLDPLGPCCPRCAVPTGEHPVVCARCVRDPLPLDAIVSAWRFGGELAAAIRRLKFSGASHVARAVAPLWAPLVAAAVKDEDALVVPVPAHWRRRMQRGYDHAWLLALYACEAAGLPKPQQLLRRTLRAPPQSTLSAAERSRNLLGAFEVKQPGDVVGRSIVLVDDVATTCATLSACALPLHRAGASKILAVTLARA